MADSSNQDRQAIESVNESLMAAFQRGDSAGLAALYADDGQLLPPNSEALSGRDAIQAYWQEGMDAGVTIAKLETLELEGFGDTAYEVGWYALYGGGNQLFDQGKFVVIWKKADGQWKLYRDIWNTSQPPG
jgi:uncharacterized protein (TIGR02246 family)